MCFLHRPRFDIREIFYYVAYEFPDGGVPPPFPLLAVDKKNSVVFQGHIAYIQRKMRVIQILLSKNVHPGAFGLIYLEIPGINCCIVADRIQTAVDKCRVLECQQLFIDSIAVIVVSHLINSVAKADVCAAVGLFMLDLVAVSLVFLEEHQGVISRSYRRFAVRAKYIQRECEAAVILHDHFVRIKTKISGLCNKTQSISLSGNSILDDPPDMQDNTLIFYPGDHDIGRTSLLTLLSGETAPFLLRCQVFQPGSLLRSINHTVVKIHKYTSCQIFTSR